MTTFERAEKYCEKMSLSELDIYEASLASYNKPDKADYLALIQKRRDAIINEQKNIKEARESRVYNLEKLDPYKQVPRDDSQFVTDVAGKAPLFGKAKWKTTFLNAPIIYGKVVQANSDLWDPGTGKDLPAVIVFALDDQHIYNIEWLTEIADKIKQLKNSNDIPKDCSKFIKTLRDDQSYFCFKVGASVAGDANAWCGTFSLPDQSLLPNSALPGNGIVPFLLTEDPKENRFLQLKMIPGKYYN